MYQDIDWDGVHCDRKDQRDGGEDQEGKNQ